VNGERLQSAACRAIHRKRKCCRIKRVASSMARVARLLTADETICASPAIVSRKIRGIFTSLRESVRTRRETPVVCPCEGFWRAKQVHCASESPLKWAHRVLDEWNGLGIQRMQSAFAVMRGADRPSHGAVVMRSPNTTVMSSTLENGHRQNSSWDHSGTDAATPSVAASPNRGDD